MELTAKIVIIAYVVACTSVVISVMIEYIREKNKKL
jgi:hypothetical protein|tara:strand:- start:1248 stop:1355 length:108 start_codon:yes stop_codon:yes gene_type:complete